MYFYLVPTLPIIIGRNVRRLRKEKGMSQQDLSYLTGMDQKYISKIERGDSNITLNTLEKLMECLEVTVAELLFDEYTI